MDIKLGFCGWLLDGVSLPEKVEFLAREGFVSIAWLQTILKADPVEREEAAAAIREKNFALTWHGNMHADLTVDLKLDLGFVNAVFDDVIWWHERTGGVVSCCSDMISVAPPGAARTYLREETLRLFQLAADRFEGTGIGYGIENAFFMPDGTGYASLAEMRTMKQRLRNAPHAGMILDAGHANVYLTYNAPGALTLDQYVRELPFKIYELHITDNLGYRDQHLLPGEGTLDFARLRAGLESRGDFDGVISLEICPDILNNQYTWDISKPENRDVIRRARDRFLAAFSQ